MSTPNAPAAAPAPSAPTSAPASAPTPSAPAADTRGAPPKGHKWAPAPPIAQKPAAAARPGAPAPAAKSAQEVATGTAQPREAKPQQPGTQREPRLVKHRLADGTEADIDISEHLERELAAYKRKVKVNGEEREFSLAEAYERLPLAEGAHQRFREASEAKKQAADTIERLKAELAPLRDPEKAFDLVARILGEDVAYGQMERRVAERLKREMMPAQERAQLEQRERADRDFAEREAKLQRERAAFEAEQKKAAEARQAQQRAQALDQLKKTVPVVLEQVELPVTPETIGRYTAIKAEALRHGIPYTDAQVAERVRAEFSEAISAMAKSLPPEKLRELLGDNAAKLQQAEVKRVMSQPGRGQQTRVAKPGKIPEAIRTPDQLRKFLREQDMAAERAARGGR